MKKSKFKMIIVILGGLLGMFIFTTLFLAMVVFGKNEVVCDCDVPNCVDSDEVISLDLNDPNVYKLYSMAHGPMNMGAMYNQYYEEKKLTSDIPYEEKLFFASTTYSSSIYSFTDQKTMETVYYLSPDAVKNALEYVFANVEYKQVDTIPYLCGYLKYDSKKEQYIGTLACGGNIGGGIVENIVKAEKYSDVIEITSAIAYYTPGSTYDYEVFKDSQSNDVIVGFSYEDDFSKEMSNYMRNNFEKFNRYKYTFKLNKYGFYKFYSIEKVK